MWVNLIRPVLINRTRAYTVISEGDMMEAAFPGANNDSVEMGLRLYPRQTRRCLIQL